MDAQTLKFNKKWEGYEMINLKKKYLLLTIVIMILSLVGCNNKGNSLTSRENKEQNKIVTNTTYPLKIKDSLNREVTIEKEPVKIISLAPNITETIYALDKQKLLIGRTDYCTYPKEVSEIKSIGSLMKPNIEKITQLRPDLVIASNHFRKEDLKKLEEVNVKVLVLSSSESFEGTYDIIKNTGKVLNANQKASEVVLAMKEKVKAVQEKVKDKNKPSVYYIVSFGKSGDFTAGKDTFIGKMLEMAGGKNAADDVRGWKYSVEKLIEKNPEILIYSNKFNSKEELKNTEGYKELEAVKKDKIFAIDEDIINRQGPRLADGLEALAKILHPESFK